MREQFDSLIEKIRQSGKPYDEAKIGEAYELANQAHTGQVRVSGEPYILHPLETASILLELGMDTQSIIAALLHDVVEDTSVTLEQLEKRFGSEVALLVDGVTKLGKIAYTSREQQQAENIRKMLLAMAQDVRVVIIKLADRLHNMRTIDVMPDTKRREKSLETMEIYAPLAHRLGISQLKEELEDISLKYLDPVGYNEIESMLNLRKEAREEFLARKITKLKERLEPEHPHMHIDGRVKSIYGIYRKMFMQGRAFEEIYDIYALRIIVDSVFECYNILGIIHDTFCPIPNRFKDYISTKKQNLYQSLHTTVLDKEAVPFEVQIRTWDMHHTAEYGVAAHWKYKAGISGKDSLEERLAWVRQLLESQKELDDIEDIVKSIKTDIAPEEVFVYTPKGDVISLPTGSTVIDFAYAIHTQVGNRMVGAKVDGRMVSLDFKVKTGMIVEVITSSSKTTGPSRDWLNIVRTSEARNKIRTWFKKERREENIAEGRAILEREFRRNLMHLSEEEMQIFLLEIAQRQRFHTVDEFCAAIGYGGISLQRIMPRIKEDYAKTYRQTEADLIPKLPKRLKEKTSSGVIVEDLEGCLVKFAKCCNPLPGDNIVGFITRGYGVSIHKRDCINVISAMSDINQQERWVTASWAEKVRESFQSTIELYCVNREALLADISVALSNMHVQIHNFNARELRDNHASIQVTLSAANLQQLGLIMASMKRVKGVISVQRAVL